VVADIPGTPIVAVRGQVSAVAVKQRFTVERCERDVTFDETPDAFAVLLIPELLVHGDDGRPQLRFEMPDDEHIPGVWDVQPSSCFLIAISILGLCNSLRDTRSR
jgi:hypothetical protein